MKKFISSLTVLVFLVSMIGCATTNPDGSPNTGASTGLGAALGAAAGALLGYAITGKAGGALAGAAIGAAAGGLTGFVIGKSRESKYKSAQQIYKENPKYAEESAKNEPPFVKNIQPYICDSSTGPCDQYSKHLHTVKNGQWVDLAMTYDVVIPEYSDNREVKVEECNYLVDAKGNEMNRSRLTREMMRDAGGNDAGIRVYVTKDLSMGKYTHIAVVRVGDKPYVRKQQVQIVKSDGKIKIYASK